MQALLGRLQLPAVAQRRTAIEDTTKLSPEEFTPLYAALLDRVRQKPDGDTSLSAMELAGKLPANWPVLTVALGPYDGGILTRTVRSPILGCVLTPRFGPFARANPTVPPKPS